MLDLKQDYFSEWHELKSTGPTNLTISPDWRLNMTDHVGPSLDVASQLTIAASDLSDLEQLSLAVNDAMRWMKGLVALRVKEN